MISSATRIAEQTPTNELTELIAELRAINDYGRVSNMLRSMSVRPSLFRAIRQALLRPGRDHLSPAQHELIAHYVAAQTPPGTSNLLAEAEISLEERML